MDYQRKMLQELMAPLIPNSERKFYDKNVCKDFLCGFCPFELFTNTKADLGSCNLIHDEKLQKAYQTCPDKERYGYERDWYRHLERLIDDMARTITKGKARLSVKLPDELSNPHRDEREEKIALVEKKISELLEKIEKYGEDGMMTEAQESMKDLDSLKLDLAALKDDSSNPMSKFEKRMEVCEVCGAFLVMNESSMRIEAHNDGKQHKGYQLIRETLAEYHQKREFERLAEPRKDFRKDSRDSGRSGDRERVDDHRNGGGDRRREDYNRRSRDYHDRSNRYKSRSKSPEYRRRY